MKKIFTSVFFTLFLLSISFAQKESIDSYKKTSAMIPMRDGIKLFTVILIPVGALHPSPVLLQRTPYGAGLSDLPDDTIISMTKSSAMYSMAVEGYIFVFQDIRGKYKSQGRMEIHQPLIHSTQKGAVDESTDTWDTIDWLIKNVPGNNGKAGIYGISYPGWLALVGAVDPHPALKASSEQACMGDLFLEMISITMGFPFELWHGIHLRSGV
jgi:putative CocE/NonD family hydrolase